MRKALFNREDIIAHCERPKNKLLNAPWEEPLFYGCWLVQTAHFVSHSSRLLALCASQCNLEQRSLHLRCLNHAVEEQGHEKLAKKDLKELGFGDKDFPENASTMSFYQTQYYWILYKSPMAFLGYTFCLEMLALEAGPGIYEKIQKHYGQRAGHFLSLHVEEDQGHVEKALGLLEHLTEQEQKYAFLNLQQSCANYQWILRDCQLQIKAKSKAA